MGSKMFPDESIVKEWCVLERDRLRDKEENRLTLAALKLQDEKMQKETLQVGSVEVKAVSETGIDEEEREAAAHVATSVFTLAAAGVILSQTPKRKLRWLVKKPS